MTPSSFPTPFSPTRSTACIVNVVRPRLFSALCLASLSVGALSLVAPRAFAAPPPVTVTQPVQVQVVNTAAQPASVQVVNPVNVQGSVETLNDALYQPYFQAQGAIFGTDPATDTAARCKFYVPAGKRLVIETVTVQASLPPGQKAMVYLHAPNATQFSIAMQSQGVIKNGYGSDQEIIVGTHPIKMRVDGPVSPLTAAFEFEGRRSADVGGGFLFTAITGYLVDL